MKNDNEILSIYLKEINKIPLLSHDEVLKLAKDVKAGSKAAKDKIVSANLRFVVNVAKQYQNRGLELTDLISEGNIGLMTAVDKFDESKGYHFISYAVWWIRQSITKAINEKSSMIRLPLNRVNELNQIKKAKKSLGNSLPEEDELVEIGQMLNLDPEHIKEMLKISQDVISFETPVSISGNGEGTKTVSDYIEEDRFMAPDENAVYSAMQDDIDDVLNTLKPNEKKVITMRYGLDGDNPKSLKEIGEVCNLTKERIRQIEKHAIVRLQHPSRIKVLENYVA